MNEYPNTSSPAVLDLPKMIERIQSLLREQKKTASRMSRELGFSSGLFSQWKQGKQTPSADRLYKIARYLGTSMDYLAGLDPYAATDELRRAIALELEPLPSDALERVLDYTRFTAEQVEKAKSPHPPLFPPNLD